MRSRAYRLAIARCVLLDVLSSHLFDVVEAHLWQAMCETHKQGQGSTFLFDDWGQNMPDPCLRLDTYMPK